MKRLWNRNSWSNFKIPLIYLLLSGCWVALSGKILFLFSKNSEIITKLEIYKCWLFILLTSLILYFLIRRDRKMKESLLETESKYRSLVEESVVGVYIIQDRKFSYVNPRFAEMHGYTQEELLQMDAISLVVPEERPHVLENIRKQIEGEEKTVHFYTRVIKKDGSIIHIEVFGHVSQVLHNAKPAIMGTVLDITEQKLAEETLMRTKQELQSTVRHQHGMTFKFKKKNGRFIHTLCEGELVYRLGLTPEKVVGKELSEILFPEEAAEKMKYYERAWQGEENVTYEGCINNIVYSSSLRPIKNKGQVVEVIAYCMDITEQKKAKKQIKESEDRYRILVELSPETIVVHRDCIILYINPAGAKTLGASSPEDIIGQSILEFISANEHQQALDQIEQVKIQNKSLKTIERGIVRLDGKTIDMELIGAAVTYMDEPAILHIGRDITERKKVQETITHMAYHDPLTNLPNRRLFKERLSTAIDYAKQNGHMLAVMFIDMDRFKMINDSLGHTIGDALLNATAERISNCVGHSDTVARFGGDEFTILLPKILQTQDVKRVAQKVINAFKQPLLIEDRELRITPSIGIAVFPHHGEDAETVIKSADMAMYHAKEQGKNNFQLYQNSMDSEICEKLMLENELRKALDNNELELFFQPNVNIASKEVIGLEALVRWNHKELGFISPAKFIPVAEETGLIAQLGEWVLRKACQQNKERSHSGLSPLPIAVNISVRQFKQNNFVEIISEILEETQVEAQWLELEITESAVMDNVEDAIAKLCRLQSMGIKVSIDDFGTGYSSLSYLKKFPIDTLKIDQSFVRDLPDDSDDAAIVTTIISMAQKLNLNVIAEGVETKAQCEFLKQNGCYEMQGYLFSKPLSAKDMEKKIKMNDFFGKTC